MGFQNVRDVVFVVDRFDDALRSNLTATQLTSTLLALNLNDAGAVHAEVRRCNNRCNGNDVDVSIRTVRATGRNLEDVQNINVKFTISDTVG